MRRAALAIVVILVGAVGAYRVLFGDDGNDASIARPATATPPALAPTPAPVRKPAPAFTIADLDGTVEVRQGGAWRRARAGEQLAPGEAIRTGDGGRATLRDDAGDELTLRPRVELSLTSLSDAVAELALTRGKLRAEATGAERLQITAAQTRTVAKGSGRFTVYADPKGTITVATEDGDVAVLAGGREVNVGAREQTTVAPGGAPSDPAAVPDEVFLSVSWPDGEVHARSATIRGKVAQGTIVSVNGSETDVGPGGTFTATVPVRAGDNPITVQAEGIDGRTKAAIGNVRADTRGPPLEADPSRLYDGSDAGARPRPR